MLTFTLQKQDVEKGQPFLAGLCPLALSVKRNKQYRKVKVNHLTVELDGTKYLMSKNAQKFRKDFDWDTRNTQASFSEDMEFTLEYKN